MAWTKNHAMCFRKVPYLTEMHANRCAERRQRRAGLVLSSYQCPYCLRWHLTKKLQPGWHPFPPPAGTFDMRSSDGVVTQGALFVDRGRGPPLYCVVGETTVGRVDRMTRKGFEWLQPDPTSERTP